MQTRSLHRWAVCCLAFTLFLLTCPHGYLFNSRQNQYNQIPLCPFYWERQHTKLDLLTNNIWTEDRLVVRQWVKNYRKADRPNTLYQVQLTRDPHRWASVPAVIAVVKITTIYCMLYYVLKNINPLLV